MASETCRKVEFTPEATQARRLAPQQQRFVTAP
jgi:hypothetical protein